MDEIERFNSVYGLVKAGSRELLTVKHILDSLSPLGLIVRLLGGPQADKDKLSGKTTADLGSGAGLPGIPLAICLPGISFTLIEKMGKRANFLRNTLAILGLSSQVTVEEKELERAEPDRFDMIVFRALSPINHTLVNKIVRLLKSSQEQNGIIAAYKGRHITAKAELTSLLPKDTVPGYTAEIISLTVPFLDEERCLAIILSGKP
ncbi:MAG: class I SAM-dependent methyltransferase [Treponema sp.]|jgi:16S rRNA (guanine527-N7)-methyltransferase|nr:class I SAM-dependent methyltransferase [Treponema sp.]